MLHPRARPLSAVAALAAALLLAGAVSQGLRAGPAAASADRADAAATADAAFAAAEPGATEPSATQPAATDPAAQDPGVGEPESAEPIALAAELGSQPNIVVFMLDDVNPMDGRYFTRQRTPNIYDLFVARGVDFTSFYTETPLCCPGRVGFLTGQHTHNHGVADLDGTVFKQKTTIATELKGAGYYTIFSGKYVNAYDDFPKWKRTPPGWDRFDAIFEGQGRYYRYRWRTKDGQMTNFGFGAQDYSTDVIARESLAALKSAPASKPLFAILNPFGIHFPVVPAPRHEGSPRCADIRAWRPPNYNEANVSDKPAYVQSRKRLRSAGRGLVRQCETLLSIDEMVGQVVEEVRRQERFRDTIFILTADNGMGYGEHRLPEKTVPYATHVPMYATWVSGRGSTPRDEATVLSNIDLAPTLCEVAGCVMGPYPNGQDIADGISFANLLLDRPLGRSRDAILESQPVKVDGASPSDRPRWWAVRTTEQHPLGSWHYIETGTAGNRFVELYDLSNGPCYAWKRRMGGDPCELHDLLAPGASPSQETLAVAATLSEKLEELKHEKGFVAP